jgi:hypothetical protein
MGYGAARYCVHVARRSYGLAVSALNSLFRGFAMNGLNWFKKLSLLLFCMFAAAQVHAQATRTWVSGVGDDANPCSRTAPCKTFAGAISKTAPGGEINVMDPGGFGAVTITKAITIDGSGGNIAGVLVSGTNGIVVNAGASDVVVLRNLDINGLGTGINGVNYLSGAALHVENSRIYGFTQQGINFAPSGGTTNALYVSHTKLLSNAGGAVFVAPGTSATATATLTDVTMEGNLRGLRIGGGVAATARNCVATGNAAVAFNAGSADSRTAVMSLESSTIASNASWGVYSGTNATVYMSNLQITGNGGGITAVGGQAVSFGNNYVAGNTTNGAPTQTIAPL